jgi:hypothetical protein
MRKIVIPAPVTLPNVTEPVTFQTFMNGNALIDSRFGVDLKTVKLARDIHVAMMTAADGTFALSEEAWSILKSVVESPKNGYDVAKAILCLSFFDAVLEATQVELVVPELAADYKNNVVEFKDINN